MKTYISEAETDKIKKAEKKGKQYLPDTYVYKIPDN